MREGAGRARNPRGQGARLREEIVDAASDLLAELGSDEALSMRAVARRVGVTPPAVYAHFPDRGALVEAVLDARFADLRDSSDAAEQRAGHDPRDRLLARAHAYCHYGLTNPGHYRVLFEGRTAALTSAGGGASSGADLLSALAHALHAAAGTPDEDGRTAADASPGHDEAALELWSALHGLVSLRLNKPGVLWPPAQRATQHAVEATLQALTRPPR